MANIIVCADGTWNRPEVDKSTDHVSNVLKLARAVQPFGLQGERQQVFYDWGLGSYHSHFTAGVTGAGLAKNILDAYRYLVHNYTLGDRLYLFGFSRGAYTVRALCGLINNCGILRSQYASLINDAWRIYKSTARTNHPRGKAASDFVSTYSHPSPIIDFVGVWDTVGALGIPFSFMGNFSPKDEFYDTKMGSNIAVARHALAIDEQRVDFEPTIWRDRAGTDLQQVWFAGVHADIGGSYGKEKGTGLEAADCALRWMQNEAANCGLAMEPAWQTAPEHEHLAKLHQSREHVFRFKRPFHRPLKYAASHTVLHPSVRRRFDEDVRYRPPQLLELLQQYSWSELTVDL